MADLLAEDRRVCCTRPSTTWTRFSSRSSTSATQLDDYLHKVPTALNLIGRAIGSYGDFVNFYACDISLKINGLQAGGPVRTVRLFNQPSGRCSPQ